MSFPLTVKNLQTVWWIFFWIRVLGGKSMPYSLEYSPLPILGKIFLNLLNHGVCFFLNHWPSNFEAILTECLPDANNRAICEAPPHAPASEICAWMYLSFQSWNNRFVPPINNPSGKTFLTNNRIEDISGEKPRLKRPMVVMLWFARRDNFEQNWIEEGTRV